MRPFDEREQRALFAAHVPGEDFTLFKLEVARFDLEPLLGNPQFLQLFADAFVESGRTFTNKRSIFADAVRRLAHVSAGGVLKKNAPAVEDIIELANEAFAKLLLSGAVGVSVVDTLADRQYPHVSSLLKGAQVQAAVILDTRLFKPSDNARAGSGGS